MDGRKRASTTQRYLSDTGADLLRRNLLPRGSVAVSCIGWQMGKVIMTSRPSFSNQQLNTIIPHDGADADFVYYSLVPWREYLLSLGSAAGVRTPILNKSAFSDLRLLMPPLDSRRKIAAILSAYDDLIENNLRRIAILEEMARLLYLEWFVHLRFPGHEDVAMVDSPLGPIPEGWEVKTLGDVIELAYGKGLKADDRTPGSVPVYGSSGVLDYHRESLVSGPGIIVGRKGNVGSVFWSEDDFYPIDTVFYVRTSLPLHYVYYNLQEQNFLNSDAAVPGLSRKQAYLNPIMVPPPEMMDAFCGLVSPLFAGVRSLREKSNVLKRTRDLLLPRLISGELDVAELNVDTGGIAA